MSELAIPGNDLNDRIRDVPSDDYSGTFHLMRGRLTADDGRRYLDFVRTLKPDYSRVKRDITIGYLFLIASAVLAVVLSRLQVSGFVVVPVGAIMIGYWIAHLQLFIHEGAHFNLAADREASDRFCDRWIGWMVGTSVRDYRVVHFQHHRALGTPEDSEFTYFFPLNLIFIFKTLFGVRAMEVLLARRRYMKDAADRKVNARPEAVVTTGSTTGSAAGKRQTLPFSETLIIGVLLHGAIILLMWLVGGWVASVSWIAGVAMVFPFLGGLRQLLEHRGEHADDGKDYRASPHGAFTRMFGDDLVSGTFGGAGFNRHLLHHWEPQVSYTKLPEIERFLMRTELGSIIDMRRSTYADALLKLFSLR